MLECVHQGAVQDRSSPVHNVQGVEVAKCTCNFGSVESGPGLQEDPLSLEMVEELERKQTNVGQHQHMTTWTVRPQGRLCTISGCCRIWAYLSTINIVQDEVQLVGGLEGVVQPHQEGMLDVLHQHTALSHDVLLLERTYRS